MHLLRLGVLHKSVICHYTKTDFYHAVFIDVKGKVSLFYDKDVLFSRLARGMRTL